MRKAIGLHVKLWITGEDAPANNYLNLTSQLVRDLIAEGNAHSANLQITIKAIQEVRDYADEDFAEPVTYNEASVTALQIPLELDLPAAEDV